MEFNHPTNSSTTTIVPPTMNLGPSHPLDTTKPAFHSPWLFFGPQVQPACGSVWCSAFLPQAVSMCDEYIALNLICAMLGVKHSDTPITQGWLTSGVSRK